jgi:6,7-dimethyl-8-ribityllumazine synthase
VICLGCIIRGETAHFDFVSQASAMGIMNVGLQYAMPVIFGVLTDDNVQQSKDRSGGKKGNKGAEAAATVIKMAALREKYNAL